MTHTLGVREFVSGATDDYGNPAEVWGSSRPWVVRGYAPGGIEEPYRDGRDLSVIAWTVYADADASLPGPRDLVVLEGREYRVNGEPSDWTKGPWLNAWAGAVVELTREEG